MPAWLALTIVSCIILLYVGISSLRSSDRDTKAGKSFTVLVFLTLFALIAEGVSYIDCKGDFGLLILSDISNFFSYGISGFLLFLWSYYFCYSLIGDTRYKNKCRFFLIAMLVISCADVIMSFISMFVPIYFGYTNEYIYYRAGFFWVHAVLLALVALLGIVMTVVNKKGIDKKAYRQMLLFLLLPYFSIVVQAIFYGIPFGLTLGSIIFMQFFISSQARSMNIDYLTGAYNRRKLDYMLLKKINSNKESFSAILIDLDHFKIINDCYGHVEGDDALIETVDIIKKCLVRCNGSIARYGGDEFCVVTDLHEQKELDGLCEDIVKAFEEFNSLKKKPYRLSITLGGLIFNPNSALSLNEFYAMIDEKMYNGKEKCR